MKFNEVDYLLWFLLLFLIIFAGVSTYDVQQKIALFKQTYNMNLGCRQKLKDKSTGHIADVCGPIPMIGDFVK
jgi:hypothetical protein